MKTRKNIRDIFATWSIETELVSSEVTSLELVTPGDTSDLNVFYTNASTDYYISFGEDRQIV